MREAIKAIEKPWDQLECVHIDVLAQECGMYEPGSENNNGYGCKSTLNTEAPGCCHTFACPIANELDNEDPRWWEGYEEGKWLIVHSKFEERQASDETSK